MLVRRLVIFLTCLTISLVPILGGSYGPGAVTQMFDFPDGTIDLKDGSEIGWEGTSAPFAGVYGNALRLASLAVTNSIASFKLPDLDPDNVAQVLDLRLMALMNKPVSAPAGEGWSINFGDILPDNGTGEGGFAPMPRGLTIAFDTFQNENETGTSIQILIGGTVLTNIPRVFQFDQVPRVVSLHWDAAGLDFSYDNRNLFTDLPLPGFAPGEGHRFAFSARTSSSGMDVIIDEVRATTVPLPAIHTGGPIISEFVLNNTLFQDEFAGEPSWIELYNGSNEPVDLTGWYLTDSKRNLTKWRIQGLVLNPFNYQVVFGSGRDRQLSAVSFPHTSFTLNSSDDFVALVRPDGTTIASSYDFGTQQPNVSFGEAGSERKRGFMFPATPGSVNSDSPAPNPRAPDVRFSHPSGLVPAPITVALSAPGSPAAEIRYTLDRTEPGPASRLYSNALPITEISTIRARAYLPGHLPGAVTRGTYVPMDGTLTNFAETGKVFESNLPLIYLDSFGVSVDGSTGGSRPFRPTFALIIPPDPVTGRATLTNAADYAGYAGTHVRGESSAGFEQKSYSLELWDEDGRDQDVSLLGMPAESDWVLYGPWSEKTFMRNKLIFDWMLALRGEDGTAVRTRFVELFFNQARPASGKISYSPAYRGIYVLMEKLKRTKDRVPLESINNKTVDPELITGGYIIRRDKDDALKNNWSSPRYGVPLQSYDPDRLNAQQLAYIRGYITSFENALQGANFRSFTSGYQSFIDADTFIDAQWMLEIAKQVDGYTFSTYFHKDRAGRLRAGPLWDFNIALGNADYGTGDRPTGWLYDNSNGTGGIWYPRLHADPDYRLAHWDRYWHLRRTIFATSNAMAAINRNMEYLLDGYSLPVTNRMPASVQNPVARHFRRWPHLAVRHWPNPAAVTRNTSWQLEVEYMKTWLTTRLDWLDDQSLRSGNNVYRPPVLNHPGGRISAPLQLAITPYHRTDPVARFPAGEIYYTTNGTDPRMIGGGVSTWAQRYSRPLDIHRSTTIQTRMFTNGVWSPLAAATFTVDSVPANAVNLVISEILFRPAQLNASERVAGLVDYNRCEFIELRNIGPHPIDLSGVKFTSGINFDFNFVAASSRLLSPGESAVVVADQRAFRVRFPLVPSSRMLGQYRGRLDNGGEVITLTASDGTTIASFAYNDDAPWPSAGETTGRSIVLRDPAQNPNPADARNWMLSASPGGTPGTSGIGSTVFTGDLLKDSDGDGQPDFFEFALGSDPENPGSAFFPAAGIETFLVNGSNSAFLTFTYTRNPSVLGVTLAIEVSSDLVTWSSGEPGLLNLGAISHQDGTITHRYRTSGPISPTSTPTLYYRLKARVQ